MRRESRPKLQSKKHLARIERERQQSRFILISSIVVFALAIGFIVYGLVDQAWIKPAKPVAVVNGESLRTSDFQAEVRYARFGIVQRWMEMYQFSQMFGDDPQMQQYFASNLQSIEGQLEKESVGQLVLDRMIENQLVREEAARRDITLSDEELETGVQEYFQFYVNGTPTPTPTFEPEPTSTLNPTQLALISPTPTFTATATATTTPVVTAEITSTATLVPTATATLAPEPTATPYTLEDYQTNYEKAMEDIDTSLKISEEQFRKIVESQLLRDKIMEAITADLTSEQEMVWARHILVADEATAQEVRAKLDSGGDFGALAAEYSTDGSASMGGDLGWFYRQKMDPDFSAAAFSLEVGEVSQPVQSQFGWHIIQVLGHETRTLSPAELDEMRQIVFRNWLAEQRETAEIKIYEDVWKAEVPEDPSIPQA